MTRLLTPIKALDAPPVRAKIETRPEQLWVKVADLRVDQAYQRQLTRSGFRLISRMVESWDWRLVQAITVAELQGGLWELIDGQHRAVAAATHGGIPMLPATVLPLGTRAEAARAFAAINSARVGVTPAQRLKAAIAAEDPDALAVALAAEQANVRVWTYPPGPKADLRRSTVAAAALLTVAKARRAEGLAAVLRICAAAGLAPIRSEHIRTIDALLHEAEWRDPGPRPAEALTRALRRWEAVADEAALTKLDAGVPLGRALQVALYRAAA